jgi:hypothetical protein
LWIIKIVDGKVDEAVEVKLKNNNKKEIIDDENVKTQAVEVTEDVLLEESNQNDYLDDEEEAVEAVLYKLIYF